MKQMTTQRQQNRQLVVKMKCMKDMDEDLLLNIRSALMLSSNFT